MLKSIVQDFPGVDIAIAIVWIQMPGFNDNLETATAIASTIDDPRVRHFYDPYPSHLAGRAFAKGLIAEGKGPAWDVYLFYGEDANWETDPPPPAAFAHQLSGGKRANPDHFRTGEALGERLHELMHEVTGAKCQE